MNSYSAITSRKFTKSNLIDTFVVETSVYKVYDSFVLVDDRLSVEFPTKAEQCAFAFAYGCLLVLMKNGDVYKYRTEIPSSSVEFVFNWKTNVDFENESRNSRKSWGCGYKLSLDAVNKKFAVCNENGIVKLFDFDDNGCAVSQIVHSKVRNPAVILLQDFYLYFLTSSSSAQKVYFLDLSRTNSTSAECESIQQEPARLCAVVSGKCHTRDGLFVCSEAPGNFFLFAAATKILYIIDVQKAVIGYFFADSAIKMVASSVTQCCNKFSSPIIVDGVKKIVIADHKVHVVKDLTYRQQIKKVVHLGLSRPSKPKDFLINNRSSTLTKVSTLERGILVSTAERLHRDKLVIDLPFIEPITNIIPAGNDVYFCTLETTYIFSHDNESAGLRLTFNKPMTARGVHKHTGKPVIVFGSRGFVYCREDRGSRVYEAVSLDLCEAEPGYIFPESPAYVTDYLDDSINTEFQAYKKVAEDVQKEFTDPRLIGNFCLGDSDFDLVCDSAGNLYIFRSDKSYRQILNLPIVTGKAKLYSTASKKQFLVYQSKLQVVITEITPTDTIPAPIQNREYTWATLDKSIKLLLIDSQRSLLLYDRSNNIRCIDSNDYMPLEVIGLSRQEFYSFNEWRRNTGNKDQTFLVTAGHSKGSTSLQVYSMRRDGTQLILNTVLIWMMGVVNPRKKTFTVGNNGGLMFMSSKEKNEYTCFTYFTIGKGLAETVYTLDRKFTNVRDLLSTQDEWVVVSDKIIWILTVFEITSERKEIRVASVQLKHALDKKSKCFVYRDGSDILFAYNSQRKIHLVKYSPQFDPEFHSKYIGPIKGIARLKNKGKPTLYVESDSGYQVVTVDPPIFDRRAAVEDHYILG